jgi:hypothetical protein
MSDHDFRQLCVLAGVRPPKKKTMTEQELYKVYAGWTGQLHYWMVKELGRHLDCEFIPSPEWLFKLYSGHAEERLVSGWGGATVPALARPEGEAKAVVKLPKPEDGPSPAELDDTFRAICLTAARILEIDLGKPKLADAAQLTPRKRRKKKQ